MQRKRPKKNKIKIILLIFLAVLFLGSGFFILRSQSDFKRIKELPERINIQKEPEIDMEIPGGRIISKNFKANHAIVNINNSNRALLPAGQATNAKFSVDEYLVVFESFDEKNKSIEITAQYFIPRPDTTASFPIFVYGSGTTGISDLCAPSKEQPNIAYWGNYQAHMLSYASQGYIVIFPDYAGFNDPERVHRYFHRELGGRVLLDSARSFYNFSKTATINTKPAETVFLGGYSHGGFAAVAAKEIAPEYAPELNIAGTVNFAPALNIEALLREAPALSPYLITAYQDVYGKNIIDISKVIQEKWIQGMGTSINLCIDKVYRHYGHNAARIYTPDFHRALFGGRLGEIEPKFMEIIEKNQVGNVSSNIPSLFIQGSTDQIVTANTVKGVARKMCDLGGSITYREHPNVNHFLIKGVGFRDALGWMENIVKGNTPESNCNNI